LFGFSEPLLAGACPFLTESVYPPTAPGRVAPLGFARGVIAFGLKLDFGAPSPIVDLFGAGGGFEPGAGVCGVLRPLDVDDGPAWDPFESACTAINGMVENSVTMAHVSIRLLFIEFILEVLAW
jgi:hypothetical protein